MADHKMLALAIYLLVVGFTWLAQGPDVAWKEGLILGAFLLPIFFYRAIAWLSGFGFPEYFARDFGSQNHPGPYGLFFWLVFLIACAFVVFDLSLY